MAVKYGIGPTWCCNSNVLMVMHGISDLSLYVVADITFAFLNTKGYGGEG